MKAEKRKAKPSRSAARRSVLQALYQWQMTGQSPLDIERQFLQSEETQAVLPEYFSLLLRGVTGHCREIDAALGEFTDRPVTQIDPIERAILRLGAYELLYHWEVPYRVVLNEAINLAKRFGATQQSYKYVNGVLDKLACKVRPAEVKGIKPEQSF